MEHVFRDLRHAGRRLLHHPASSFIAVVAMALGIGLTGAMFGIIDGVYLRGLPFEDSHELMHLERNNLERGIESMEVTRHDFEDWRKQQTSFESLAGWTGGTFNLADEVVSVPQRYNGAFISANFLEIVGVEPIRGRGFLPEDEADDAAGVILLGYQVWQSRYGGAEDIVGKTVRLNSKEVTVVGVAPEGFEFPIDHDLWMPLQLGTAELQRGEGTTLEVFGRIRDGVSVEAANAELTGIAAQLAQQFPETNEGVGAVIKPYIFEYIGEHERTLTSVMFAAVCLVLLIACFNVANLLVGRAALRGRELAIRSALGSSRMWIVRQVMSESFLISILGSALGLGMAGYLVGRFGVLIETTDPPFWFSFGVDARLIGVVVFFAALSTVVAGLVPAIQAARANVTEVLQDASRGTTSFRVSWVSKVLVVLQLGISCALLIAAGLTVRNVIRQNAYELSFDPENVLTARYGLFEGKYPEGADWVRFHTRLREVVAQRDDVVSVATSNVIPLDTEIGSGMTRFMREGETYEDPRQMPVARWNVVSPGFFSTMGIELLGGRDFTEMDNEDSSRVAIVNRDFAEKEFPEQNPIGKRFQMPVDEGEDEQDGWVEIVGMVANTRFAEFDEADDQQAIYLPVMQNPLRFTWLVVKTRTDPVAFAETLRRQVLEVDRELPLYFVRSMDEVTKDVLFFPRLFSIIFGAFGLAALFLACLGVYGVMAFSVSRRTQEVGVRMALGARSRDVVGMLVGQGLKQTAIGLSFGLVLGFGMAKLLESVLFQVEALDPVTFTTIPLILMLSAALACFLPARKASAVDPVQALRYE